MKAKSSALKKKIIGATSDVMSFPSRFKHGMRSDKYKSRLDTLKRAKAWDNAPDYDEKGMPTAAFKDRSAAYDIKNKLKAN